MENGFSLIRKMDCASFAVRRDDEWRRLYMLLNIWEQDAENRGAARGIREGRTEDARRMILKNYSDDSISQITEIPLEQIAFLRRKISSEIS